MNTLEQIELYYKEGTYSVTFDGKYYVATCEQNPDRKVLFEILKMPWELTKEEMDKVLHYSYGDYYSKNDVYGQEYRAEYKKGGAGFDDIFMEGSFIKELTPETNHKNSSGYYARPIGGYGLYEFMWDEDSRFFVWNGYGYSEANPNEYMILEMLENNADS